MWIAYATGKKDQRQFINLNRVENVQVGEKDIIFWFREGKASYERDDYVRVVKETDPEIYKRIENFLEKHFDCKKI